MLVQDHLLGYKIKLNFCQVNYYATNKIKTMKNFIQQKINKYKQLNK